MKILITGGCGFIGHHLVEHLYLNTDWQIYVIDKLSYASKGFERLRDSGVLGTDRVKVFCFDLSRPITDGLKYELGEIDIIAMDEGILCFIEVKTRSSLAFGWPQEAVNTRKKRKIVQVALSYLKEKRIRDREIRFDVVSQYRGDSELIKDAFQAGHGYF